MNTKRSVKLIKKADRKARQPKAEVGLTADVSMTKAVKSWVSEFQKDREEDESLSAFDSLFNHSLPEPDTS